MTKAEMTQEIARIAGIELTADDCKRIQKHSHADIEWAYEKVKNNPAATTAKIAIAAMTKHFYK